MREHLLVIIKLVDRWYGTIAANIDSLTPASYGISVGARGTVATEVNNVPVTFVVILHSLSYGTIGAGGGTVGIESWV